jgi:formylmethanofuran dehydrogenase subunit A
VDFGLWNVDFGLQILHSEIHIPKSEIENRVQITKESFFTSYFVMNLENYCNFEQFLTNLHHINDEL